MWIDIRDCGEFFTDGTVVNDGNITALIAIAYVIITVAFLFHIVGMILILTKSSEMTNQSLLLLHLSTTSIALLAVNVYAVYSFANSLPTNIQFRVTFYTIYIAYVVNLLLLGMDRLALAFLDIRYSHVMSRKMFTLQIALLWILSVTFGLVTKYVAALNGNMNIRQEVSFSYNGFVVLFTAFSYVTIYIRVRSSRENVQSAGSTLSRDLFKKYLIPACLVLSYFLLNLVPSIIERFINNTAHRRDVTIALIGLNCLNNLVEPIIYVFLQRSIRQKLAALCHLCFDRITIYRTISENQISAPDKECAGFRDNLGSETAD